MQTLGVASLVSWFYIVHNPSELLTAPSWKYRQKDIFRPVSELLISFRVRASVCALCYDGQHPFRTAAIYFGMPSFFYDRLRSCVMTYRGFNTTVQLLIAANGVICQFYCSTLPHWLRPLLVYFSFSPIWHNER